jgi:hypothetical protein
MYYETLFSLPLASPFALKHLRPSVLTKLASPEPLINTGAITLSNPLAQVDPGHERCIKPSGSQFNHLEQT